MTETGHNSGDEILNQTAQSQLKSFVERIIRLEEEKAEIAEQVKEVKAEAKGNGFNTKVLAKLAKLAKQAQTDPAKVREEKAILDLYATALGIEDLV